MKKRYLVLLLGLVLVLILSITFYKTRKFSLLDLKKGDVQEAIYGLGTVKAHKVYEIKIGVLAPITKLFVHEGDKVKKNDRLISFEGLGDFKAPFDGTITATYFQEGEIATVQTPVLRMENLQQKYIEVSLEQDAALRVKPGQKAQIIFESITGQKLQGLVKNIFPKNGEFLTHIDVEHLEDNILPGMTADIVIEVGSKKDVLLIPIKAISDGRVVRMRNEKKQSIEIQIGHTDGEWAELLQGDLMLTDKLVIKGK